MSIDSVKLICTRRIFFQDTINRTEWYFGSLVLSSSGVGGHPTPEDDSAMTNCNDVSLKCLYETTTSSSVYIYSVSSSVHDLLRFQTFRPHFRGIVGMRMFFLYFQPSKSTYYFV